MWTDKLGGWNWEKELIRNHLNLSAVCNVFSFLDRQTFDCIGGLLLTRIQQSSATCEQNERQIRIYKLELSL